MALSERTCKRTVGFECNSTQKLKPVLSLCILQEESTYLVNLPIFRSYFHYYSFVAMIFPITHVAQKRALFMSKDSNCLSIKDLGLLPFSFPQSQPQLSPLHHPSELPSTLTTFFPQLYYFARYAQGTYQKEREEAEEEDEEESPPSQSLYTFRTWLSMASHLVLSGTLLYFPASLPPSAAWAAHKPVSYLPTYIRYGL